MSEYKGADKGTGTKRTHEQSAVDMVNNFLDELKRFGEQTDFEAFPAFDDGEMNTYQVEGRMADGELNRDDPMEASLWKMEQFFSRLAQTAAISEYSGGFYTDEAPSDLYEEERESYDGFMFYGEMVFSQRNPYLVYQPFVWYTPEGGVGLEIRNRAPTRQGVTSAVRFDELFDDGTPTDAFVELTELLLGNADRLDRADVIAGQTKLSFMQAAVLLFTNADFTDEEAARSLDTIASTVATHRKRARGRFDECLDEMEEIRETLSVLRDLNAV